MSKKHRTAPKPKMVACLHYEHWEVIIFEVNDCVFQVDYYRFALNKHYTTLEKHFQRTKYYEMMDPNELIQYLSMWLRNTKK